jgi:hypothetical protein
MSLRWGKATLICFAVIGGGLLPYGLKENFKWACVGGVLIVLGASAQLIPQFRYRHLIHKEATTIYTIGASQINNRIQLYTMLMGIVLVIIGGSLAREHIINPVLPWVTNTAWKVWGLFAISMVAILIMVAIIAFIFRDKYKRLK